jgi:hypothetical protein
MSKFALCIHAHFYQPPRANPLTGRIGLERSAAPYRNWNERAKDEVYEPNATNGNFKRFSFDIGDDYLKWLITHHPKTSREIIAAVQENLDQHKAGNALAAPLHQCPLPMLSSQDRLTQLTWGAATAKSRFGYTPKGVFLPQFAADDATLQSVVDVGFSYTVLRTSQVEGLHKRGGAGPYRLTLDSGDSLAVFVVNDTLTSSMFTEMTERGGAGYWARQKLATHLRHAGKLTLLYVDGELLGQHRIGEAHFVHYLLEHEAPAVAMKPTTLERYFHHHPETIGEIFLLPNAAINHEETSQLAQAVKRLKTDADGLFAQTLGQTAWQLRNQAIDRKPENAHEAELVASQIALQSAFAKSLVVDDDIRVERVQVFQDVAHALTLMQSATGTDLSEPFIENIPQDAQTRFVKMLDEFRQSEVEGATTG